MGDSRMDLVQSYGRIAFLGAITVAILCWFVAVINMFRTVAHRKPGIPLFSHWLDNPFNLMLRPGQLTERGVTARRWCMYGVVGFLFCFVLGAVIGQFADISN